LAVATVLAISTGGGGHGWRARGLNIRLPPGWNATAAPLTPVGYPQFAIASYRLPQDDRGADGCEPKAALDRLPPTGVLIFAWELPLTRGDRNFPRWPRPFELRQFARYEGLGPSYLLRFRAAGRYFQMHVVLGKRASGRTRRLALSTLDSLVVRRR